MDSGQRPRAGVRHYLLSAAAACADYSVAGWFYGDDLAQDALRQQADGVLGDSGARQIDTMIDRAWAASSQSWSTTLFGFAGLLFGATGAFAQLQAALNEAWEVEPDDARGGIRCFLTKRLLSFGMVITIAFLLVTSLAVSAGIKALVDYSSGSIGAAVYWMREGFTLCITAILFLLIFKVLPDARIRWREAALGGSVTGLLFVLGKFGFSYYLGSGEIGRAFGPAGALVVILAWIYFVSVVMLGAQTTQVWARRIGVPIVPENGAVRIIKTKKKRHELDDG